MSNFNELIKKVQEKYPDIQKYVGKSKNEKTIRYKSSKLKNYFYIYYYPNKNLIWVVSKTKPKNKNVAQSTFYLCNIEDAVFKIATIYNKASI